MNANVIWTCPACGAENVDPQDTEVFHCSSCHARCTYDGLDPQRVWLVPEPKSQTTARRGEPLLTTFINYVPGRPAS